MLEQGTIDARSGVTSQMKIGLAFSNIQPFAGPVEAVRLAQTAEKAGFESVWTVDHVVVPAGYRSKYPL
jgi:alkanesulfonate monooxygenase SsuD/methylene tetrahydromethanopterin reductase-like flavin-dependent oxidoreductase (luciferase family)